MCDCVEKRKSYQVLGHKNVCVWSVLCVCVCACVQNVQSVLCGGKKLDTLSYKCVQQLTKFSLTLGCRCVRG